MSISWDDLEDAPESQEEDFLEEAEPTEVPKACSIDQPDCEACQ